MRYLLLALLVLPEIAAAQSGGVATSSPPRTYEQILSLASNWSDLGVLVIAIGALIYAGAQVRAARQANLQTLHVSTATFLLQLNERWHQLSEQRATFSKLYKEMFDEISAGDPYQHDAEKFEKFRIVAQKRLKHEKNEHTDTYGQIVQYVSFFEFAGLMIRNGYIPVEDIVALYKGPILDIDIMFTGFIHEWQKDPRMPEGLLENLLYLIERVKVE